MNNSREWLAKNIGFPVQDTVTGTSILETLAFLKKSQFWDETKIREYQLKKLKSLIDYSSKNVPYYEELFGRIKLKSSDINNVDDVSKIPILTKDTLQQENASLISRTFGWKYIKKSKTGGTTGAPTLVYKDVNDRSFTWASYYRWFEWMGLEYFDPVTTFWGARGVLSVSLKSKIKDNLTQYLQNNIVLNSFNINENTASIYYDRISRQNPYLIKGYLSSLLDFAKFVERNNWEFDKLKAISTTTETLLPNNREYLESIFKVPVYDQYGCGEISGIAYECAKHQGLHINHEHVICEILDDENKQLINQSGRLITTDLNNYIMPLIRYENGDIATITDEKCTCGVKQPLMKSIEGRSTDTITLINGNRVHGVFFTDIFYEIGILSSVVQKFQVVQFLPGEIDLRIQCSMSFDDELRKKLISNLMQYFSKVNFSEHETLNSEPNGKFRYIINAVSS